MAEMLASKLWTKTSQGLPATVLREDAQVICSDIDLQGFPWTAFGAGHLGASTTSCCKFFRRPIYTTHTWTSRSQTEAGRLAQFETPVGDTRAVAMSMPNQRGFALNRSWKISTVWGSDRNTVRTHLVSLENWRYFLNYAMEVASYWWIIRCSYV